MRKTTKYLRPFFLGILAAILTQCANIVAPSGGPRDIKPPAILQMTPADNSVSFRGTTLSITFDEYVEIKDIANELFISPPMPKLPEVSVKGKRVIIHLPNDLRDSTTYTLSFGKAIRDITEGNILENFTYSFSTGPFRDSLEIKGSIVDAFTGEPLAGILACLYVNLADSAFISESPQYIARTNATGDFVLRNLANSDFRLYALKDVNSNYYYDQPNESIAFISDTLRPDLPIIQLDTSSAGDKDTMESQDYIEGSGPQLLRMFEDRDTTQALLKTWLMKRQLIIMSFRNPIDSLQISALSILDEQDWNILNYSNNKDTVFCWITSDLGDSLTLVISDVGKTLDTIELSLTPRMEGRSPRRGGGEERHSFMPLSNVRMATDAHHPIEIISPYPIKEVIADRLLWITEEDTITPEVLVKEDDPTRLKILAKAEPGEKYIIVLPDSSILNMLNHYNDAVTFTYQMRRLDEYGKFQLSLVNAPQKPWFVELLDKDSRYIERLKASEKDVIEINRMLPGKYKLRLIQDLNGNGRWDPGYFKAGIQPEPVQYFPGEIEIRAKWEREETWKFPE